MTALYGDQVTLTIDGEERALEVFSASVAAAKVGKKDVTFGEANSGTGNKYNLNIEITQDMSEDSLWNVMWDMPGSLVPVLVRPNGNAVPTVDEPHFSGTVKIVEPEGELFGGVAAGEEPERWRVKLEWPFTARPIKITAPPVGP